MPGEIEGYSTYTRNLVGSLAGFKGQKADYVYDYEIANDTDLGLLRRVDYFNAGSSTPNETVGYTYDPFGRHRAGSRRSPTRVATV